MQITVNLTREEEEKLHQEAKKNVRRELTDTVLREYLKTFPFVNIIDALNNLGLYERYQKLLDTPVKNLDNSDKMIVMLKWIMYDKLR